MPQEFYKLYCNIEEQCLQYCLWVLLYCCYNKDCTNSWGFLCAGGFVVNDSDLPIELQNSIATWSTIIHDALNYRKILPDTTKAILANYNGSGYTFIWQGCILFHPNLVTNPISLSPMHLKQGRMSYDDYVQADEFYYNMKGFLLTTGINMMMIIFRIHSFLIWLIMKKYRS